MPTIAGPDPRFQRDLIVFVKASLVLKAGDRARYFGARKSKMWLPGRVLLCETRESAKGRKMRYIQCLFYAGGVITKAGKIGI